MLEFLVISALFPSFSLAPFPTLQAEASVESTEVEYGQVDPRGCLTLVYAFRSTPSFPFYESCHSNSTHPWSQPSWRYPGTPSMASSLPETSRNPGRNWILGKNQPVKRENIIDTSSSHFWKTDFGPYFTLATLPNSHMISCTDSPLLRIYMYTGNQEVIPPPASSLKWPPVSDATRAGHSRRGRHRRAAIWISRSNAMYAADAVRAEV